MGGRGRGAGGVLAAVALIVAAVLISWLPSRGAAAPSSSSAAPAGMLALYLLLQGEGVPVGRVTGTDLPADGVLVGAAGAATPSLHAMGGLLGWVGTGHEAVILGSVGALAEALGLGTVPAPFGDGHAVAAAALPELRGAGALWLPQAVWLVPGPEAASGLVVLYTVAGEPAAVRVPVGRGELYWLGSAQAWSNATLARAPGNVVLAQNLLRSGGRVWFDEYWFGRGAAFRPVAARHPVAVRLPLPRNAGLALLGLACAAAAGLWAAGWRRHPVRREPPPAPAAAEPVRAYAETLLRTRVRPRGGPGRDRRA